MKIITTLWKHGIAVTAEEEKTFQSDENGVEESIINLYPQVHFQKIIGFGGAFTESAGYVLSKMPEEKAKEIIKGYFGPNGLRYSIGRTHIDSCDFSLDNYSAVPEETNIETAVFDLSRDEAYIMPVVAAAREAAGKDIPLLMAPWSPPSYMKTNGQKNGGGKLRPEYRAQWAEYLCRYIEEYQQRGFPVFSVSVQNEPKATQKWDSCVYTAQEESNFAWEYLAPALRRHGLTVPIMIWDHNKERLLDRTEEILSDKRSSEVDSVIGFHWYSGDHFEAVELVHKQYPDKLLVFSEGCVEYSKFGADSQLKNAQMYAHDIIGNLNAGMNAFVDWNLVLNSKGGPNHTGNLCDAPVMCNLEDGTYEINLSYEYIGHFSRYIDCGAKRIGMTRFSDRLEVTAFQNPSGSLVAVVLNRGDEGIRFHLRLNDRICPIVSKANSISTIVMEQEQ